MPHRRWVKQALIVIDLQQGFVHRRDAEGLVQRLNGLAASVRATGGEVVFIQHDGPPGDRHHPDLPGWRLLPTLEVEADDTIIRKTSCDAFLGTTLDEFLRSHAIKRLILTGCATDYCVDTTVRSALAGGYPTIVPLGGHTTMDRPHLAADKIIEHHNAIWADFLAPRRPAMQCRCAEVPLG